MLRTKKIQIIKLLLAVIPCAPAVMADHTGYSFETGGAGAIMTLSGTTLPESKVAMGVNMQVIEFDAFSDEALEAFGAADEHVHSIDDLFQFQANLAYGVTGNLTVGAGIPYIERDNIRAAHHHMGMGEAEAAGDASGLGDMRLFGQYRVYHDTAQNLALIAGIKTPTGATGERETEGELFETDHQPGSGSWDPFFGLAYDRSFGRAGFSANVLYTCATAGSQQTELGDSFNYNLALSYRLFTVTEMQPHDHGDGHDRKHHKHTGSLLDYIDMALELNGDARGKNKIGGVDDINSGGHMLYLSPGLRIGFAHHWSLFTSIGIPVVNDNRGHQSDPDYRVIGGISTAF